MKAILGLSVVAGALVSLLPAGSAPAQEKTIAVYVWLDGELGAIPAENARVEATRSLRLPASGPRYRQKLQQDATVKNKYTLQLQNAPKSIDIGIDRAEHHSLAICDLAGNESHSLHVRLFNLQTPLAAPECFALKTRYEFLFRREQQDALPPVAPRAGGLPPGAAPPPGAPPVAPPLAPPGAAPPRRPVRPGIAPARLDDEDARRAAYEAERRAIQRSARLKYADGLLALPNPNRPRKTQSAPTRAMLDQMQRDDPDGYDELQDMVAGLFKLYGMEGFSQHVPGKWESVYFAGDRRVAAEVEILGTHGTYRTRDGVHRLENLDFIDDNENGGYILTGNFRYKPGTANEVTGEIRWKMDERGFQDVRMNGPGGRPSWSGTLHSGPYFPEE
jgi:hypothetical protein